MKHIITTTEAATLLEVWRKIRRASNQSPVIMAALDIDKHDVEKCERLLNNLEK